MKKITKVILILLLLFIFFPLIYAMITLQKTDNIPHILVKIYHIPFIQKYLLEFIFWCSSGLLILLGIALLIVIFYPLESKTIKLKSENGNLVIQKKALESFLSIIIQKSGIIELSNIHLKIQRNKLKIYISGKINKTENTSSKLNVLTKKIKEDLNDLFSIQHKLTIDIIFKDYQSLNDKNTTTKMVRVQ